MFSKLFRRKKVSPVVSTIAPPSVPTFNANDSDIEQLFDEETPEADAPIATPQLQPVQTRKDYTPKIETERRLLTYLKSIEGQPVTLVELSETFGYNSGASAMQRAVKELMREKAITRQGHKGSYSYKVNRLKIYDSHKRRTTQRVVGESTKSRTGSSRKASSQSSKKSK